MNREVTGLLESINDRLDEAILVEAHQDLIDLMEDVGYELDAETLGEALEAVEAFMESEEFYALSEEEQSKIKKGFKMVFGKLRKLGAAAKQIGGELMTKRGRAHVKHFVKSGGAADVARKAVRKGVDKALGALDKASGGRVEKGLSGSKAGAAIHKAYMKSKEKDKASEKKQRDYYKKLTAKDWGD